MADTTRDDPFPAYNFIVEIDGLTVKGSFTEVSGLETEIQVIEYRNGGDIAVRKLPGLNKNNDVTLKRGVVADSSLWNWFKSVRDGSVFRTNVVITLLDDQRKPVRRWKLSNAWPRKYTGPAFNAKGNDVAIESLEVTHEGLDVE